MSSYGGVCVIGKSKINYVEIADSMQSMQSISTESIYGRRDVELESMRGGIHFESLAF